MCDDGFWLITPRGGGFPFYGALNCAEHPADIGGLAVWSVVECDGCGSVPVQGSVGVSCDGAGFTPPPSTAGAGGVGGVVAGTPSPAGVDGVTETSAAGGGRGRVSSPRGTVVAMVGVGMGVTTSALGAVVATVAVGFAL